MSLGRNFQADPQYCGAPEGNYFLQSDSPCAPDQDPNPVPCGLIGAFPVDCGISATFEKSWGAIKEMYRD